MDLVSVEGLKLPIEFSKKVIDWAAGTDEIRQGYAAEVNAMMRQVGNRYSWGLFE
jgi:hypothetical protein